MEKRELPTRHNFLTEAVQNLLEPKNTNTEPSIDLKTVLTVTSDPQLINTYKHYDAPAPEEPPLIKQIPEVRMIEPVALSKKDLLAQQLLPDDRIEDDYYLKRHRKHELDEKKQKNREKERLKHGYYQQKQLVERLEAMDMSLLQSIVSSIRHRAHKKEEGPQEEEDDEEYLHGLYQRLLDEALEHLQRYEALGLSTARDFLSEEVPESLSPSTSTNTSTQFQLALQSEAKMQRTRQIKSFSGAPTFTGDIEGQGGSRRSTRRVVAFGQKLPPFEIQEFELPGYILEWQKDSNKT